MNEGDVIIIDKCPACGGRHALSGQDQIDYICMGSPNKSKKLWQNMEGSALTATDGTNSRFDTKTDERRDTTIIGFTPDKEKGRMYRDSDKNY